MVENTSGHPSLDCLTHGKSRRYGDHTSCYPTSQWLAHERLKDGKQQRQPSAALVEVTPSASPRLSDSLHAAPCEPFHHPAASMESSYRELVSQAPRFVPPGTIGLHIPEAQGPCRGPHEAIISSAGCPPPSLLLPMGSPWWLSSSGRSAALSPAPAKARIDNISDDA